jgi:hemerythrin-like domain-containing protein
MDIFTLLKEEHRAVERGFDRFLSEQEDVYELRSVCNSLERHMDMEEQVLYPRLEEYDELSDLVSEAYDEHLEARGMLEELQDINEDTTGIRDTVQQLLEAIRHHVEEEENEVFPRMREAFTQDELNELMTECQELKKTLSKQGQR